MKIFFVHFIVISMILLSEGTMAGGVDPVQYLSDEDKVELIHRLIKNREQGKRNESIKQMVDFHEESQNLLEVLSDGTLSPNYLIDGDIPLLTYSVLSENLVVVDYLLDNNKNDIEDSSLQRSLGIACVLDNYEIVVKLISAGAKPNISSNSKYEKCIFSAINNGNLNLVKYLTNIEEGSIKNKHGLTPLEYVNELLKKSNNIKSYLQ